MTYFKWVYQIYFLFNWLLDEIQSDILNREHWKINVHCICIVKLKKISLYFISFPFPQNYVSFFIWISMTKCFIDKFLKIAHICDKIRLFSTQMYVFLNKLKFKQHFYQMIKMVVYLRTEEWVLFFVVSERFHIANLVAQRSATIE